MAWAIYMGRKGESHSGIGYVPWWVGEIRLAEKFAAYHYPNGQVNFRKYIWKRRAQLLAEAEYHASSFEPKKK